MAMSSKYRSCKPSIWQQLFLTTLDRSICQLSHLSTHTRFALTLRTQSSSNQYHRLLLFRLSPLVEDGTPELYCMESTCPHMGAPLSHAPLSVDPPEEEASRTENVSPDIEDGDQDEQDLIDRTLNIALAPELASEDIEDLIGSRTITCPWHHYDFDLVTGESPVGIQACVYDVNVEKGNVWVKGPELDEGDGWEVVEVKGVSEEFADPPPGRHHGSTSTANGIRKVTDNKAIPSSTELPPLPRTLVQAAIMILNTPNPLHKIELTRQANRALRQGTFQSILPTKRDLSLVREMFDKARYEGKGIRGFTPPREGLKEVEPWIGGKRGKGGNEKSRILMIREFLSR